MMKTDLVVWKHFQTTTTELTKSNVEWERKNRRLSGFLVLVVLGLDFSEKVIILALVLGLGISLSCIL